MQTSAQVQQRAMRREAHLSQQVLKAGVGPKVVVTGIAADVEQTEITDLETLLEPLDGFFLLSCHGVTARDIRRQTVCLGKAGDQGLGRALSNTPERVVHVDVDGANPDVDTPADLSRLDTSPR